MLLTLTATCGWAGDIVLFLKNGDRITGSLVSESADDVTVSTSWGGQLKIPVSAIQAREVRRKSPPAVSASSPTNAPPVVTGAVKSSGTNLLNVVISDAPPKVKHWKGEARIGADFSLGAKDQEIYSGRLKLGYARPYSPGMKEGFRNTFDYTVDYGRTEGVLSANRMLGSDKFDFDIGKRYFLYTLAEVGYDEIRRIDLQYQVGPGLGYRLYTLTNFLMNLEFGISYQVQQRSDDTTTRNAYPRLAQDLTWNIRRKLTFTERLEFFPRADLQEFRARAELGLSYGFWQNLSLNLTLLDTFDSDPATDVPNNDLQIRSSLGISF